MQSKSQTRSRIFWHHTCRHFCHHPHINRCADHYRKSLKMNIFTDEHFTDEHSHWFMDHCFKPFFCVFFRKTSGILSSFRFRQQDHKPLPHLNSIVYNSQNSPVFIISDRPTIYFIGSLLRFYNNMKYPNKGTWLNDGIRQYIENFAQNTKCKFSLNWFLRQEILFVLDLLKLSTTQEMLDKSIRLQVAYKVLTCLTETQIDDVLHIFSQFIFNIDMYPHTLDLSPDTMNKLKSTYGRICAEFYLNNTSAQVNMIFISFF